jgi:hypothetical protein
MLFLRILEPTPILHPALARSEFVHGFDFEFFVNNIDFSPSPP